MRKKLLYLSLMLFGISCANNHNKNGVELAMQHYNTLIKKMDADSIAWLYTPDGDLGDIKFGRDSIRSFLSSFKNVSVLSQTSTTSSMTLNADTSMQTGTYQQTVVVNGKDTLKLKGDYNATWLWMQPGEWHIKKMITKPIK